MHAGRLSARALACLLACSGHAASLRPGAVRRAESVPTSVMADDGRPEATASAVGSLTMSTVTTVLPPAPTSSANSSILDGKLMPEALHSASEATDTRCTPPAATITLPPGALPLPAERTPAFIVAGAVLLLPAGLALCFVPERFRRTRIFLSTALIVALAVEVLILYLLPTTTIAPDLTATANTTTTGPAAPVQVSPTQQGLHLLAATLPAIAVGLAAALLSPLRDAAEPGAALLGGFAVAMWLLSLSPRGLVTAGPARVAFVALMSVAGLVTGCVSFGPASGRAGGKTWRRILGCRWRRSWGLAGGSAFAGATAAVLGVDCLSAAGWKEMWVWLWGVNDGLFIVSGTSSYPLTRGIKVELAAVVVLAVAKIVYKLRLWKVVAEKRHEKEGLGGMPEGDSERDEASLTEEGEVGRRVQAVAAGEERRRWEALYGDGADATEAARLDPKEEMRLGRTSTTDDSGVGGLATPRGAASPRTSPENMHDVATETQELPPPPPPPESSSAGAARPIQGQPHTAAVMLLADRNGSVVVRVGQDDIPHDDERRCEMAELPGDSPVSRTEASKGPEIVPLPFRIPEEEPEPENRTGEDNERSSAATFADDNEVDDQHARGTRPLLLVRRISRIPNDSAGSLSNKPQNNEISQMCEGGEESNGQATVLEESRSHVDEVNEVNEDNESLAATADDMSSIGDELGSVHEARSRPESTAEIASKDECHTAAAVAEEDTMAASNDGLDLQQPKKHQHFQGEPDATTCAMDSHGAEPTAQSAPSASSSTARRASLTADRLPRALSRVALSYRTNEWAKHLSVAETPHPDELVLPDSRNDAGNDAGHGGTNAEEGAPPSHADAELPVPVNVAELSQTAEAPQSFALPPRKNHRLSHITTPQLPQPPQQILVGTGGGNHVSAVSQSTANQASAANVFRPQLPETLAVKELSLPPAYHHHPSPSQTLLGRREMMLWNRSQGSVVQPWSASQVYPPPPSTVDDTSDDGDDDMPLSQRRRSLLRQQSFASLSGRGVVAHPQPVSNVVSQQRHVSQPLPPLLHQTQSFASLRSRPPSTSAMPTATFDSHQPERDRESKLPSESVRQSRLAAFRASVAADLVVAAPQPSIMADYHHRLAATSRESLHQQIQHQHQRDSQLYYAQQLAALEAERARAAAERAANEAKEREAAEAMRSARMMELHRAHMRKLQAEVVDSR